MDSWLDANEPPLAYEVVYVDDVVAFMMEAIWSRRVYEKVNSYRRLLADLPDLGAPYDPEYPAARPPFPCRRLPVPDTPFTFYYYKDDEMKRVVVFYIEHQGANPESRFEWGCVSF